MYVMYRTLVTPDRDETLQNRACNQFLIELIIKHNTTGIH